MMFKPPRRLVPSSVINETDEVRAERGRDLEEAARRAVPYLGADEVERVVHDIIKGQRGNTPDEERNARILAKYYSAPGNKSKTAREFVKDHPEEKFGAVKRQLIRLLKAEARRERRERWKAKAERRFQELLQHLGRSFVGSVDSGSDLIPSETNKIRRRVGTK
jgi:hypothetical protein